MRKKGKISLCTQQFLETPNALAVIHDVYHFLMADEAVQSTTCSV
jgi:hypothetical protein